MLPSSPHALTGGIAALGSHLPGPPLGMDRFHDGDDSGAASGMRGLRGPARRHHVAKGQRASEMIADAAHPLFALRDVEPAGNVDVLITNVLLPDNPITGSGAEVAARLGCVPETIIDLHNAGCGSFVLMLQLADALMTSSGARTALVCAAQNSAGQVYEQPRLRRKPQAAVLGDGCGVAYLVAGEGRARARGRDPQRVGRGR